VSSRVPADPNIREKEGRGLTEMRSARKGDGSGVTMFRKVRPYQQSTKDTIQYLRAVPPGTTTLPIDWNYRPTVDGSGVTDCAGLPKRAWGRGGEGRLNEPL